MKYCNFNSQEEINNKIPLSNKTQPSVRQTGKWVFKIIFCEYLFFVKFLEKKYSLWCSNQTMRHYVFCTKIRLLIARRLESLLQEKRDFQQIGTTCDVFHFYILYFWTGLDNTKYLRQIYCVFVNEKIQKTVQNNKRSGTKSKNTYLQFLPLLWEVEIK